MNKQKKVEKGVKVICGDNIRVELNRRIGEMLSRRIKKYPVGITEEEYEELCCVLAQTCDVPSIGNLTEYMGYKIKKGYVLVYEESELPEVEE